MKKDTLYISTLMAISLIVFLIGYISMTFLVKSATKTLLDTQIKSSKREATEFAKIISFQLMDSISKNSIIKNTQKSIENSNKETGFISMLDWSGRYNAHPNPKMIGKETSANDSFVQSVKDELSSNDLYNLLFSKGNLDDSEIIYLFPVKNSDWIISANINILAIKNQLAQLKQHFLFVYFITSFIIVLLTLLVIRFVSNRTTTKLELKNEELLFELLKISKVNNILSSKAIEKTSKKENADAIDRPKNRIITYLRDEIITIETSEIAFIQIENSITYVTNLKGIRYMSNSNLDELYTSFDQTQFFRVNRQFIVSINAIDKIFRYGTSQLKITTKPESDNMIISKNKAAAFKKWLNK